jgi:hypothetical protein
MAHIKRISLIKAQTDDTDNFATIIQLLNTLMSTTFQFVLDLIDALGKDADTTA